jgi:hypothetical protein
MLMAGDDRHVQGAPGERRGLSGQVMRVLL